MKEKFVVCRDCGFKYDGEQKLCPMCGSRRRSGPAVERPSPKRVSPKFWGGLVILAGMALLMLVQMKVYRGTIAPEPAPAPEPGDSAVTETVPAEPETSVPVRPEPEPRPEPVPQEMTEEQLRRGCQAVVDDYSARMRAATPRLMEEFKAETQGEKDGRVLAYVCNKKIGELAELCNSGLSEIWELLYEEGIDPSHEDYDSYTDYEFRLNLVYEDEAMKISDLYSEYYILHAS